MRRVNEQTTYESNYKSQQFKENLVNADLRGKAIPKDTTCVIWISILEK